MINFKRFEANFNAISIFGALKGGGLTRLAFSKEDLEARNFLINLIEENGFKHTKKQGLKLFHNCN